jgi:hypothetical protein
MTKTTPLPPRRGLLKRNIAIDRLKRSLEPEIHRHYARARRASLTALERWFVEADLEFCAKRPPGPDGVCRSLGSGRASYLWAREELVTVLSAERFIKDCVELWEGEKLNRPGRTDLRTILAAITGLAPEAAISSAEFRSEHPGKPRPVYWFARASDVDLIIADTKTQARIADRVRDALGLSHPFGTPLVLLRLPAEHLDRGAVPTFVDAGGHGGFACWPDDDECGYTWDLQENQSGVAEIVSVALPLEGGATRSIRRAHTPKAYFLGTALSDPPPLVVARLPRRL